MIHCHDIKRDYFEIRIFELKQEYFKKNYLKSAQKVNSLLLEISKYRFLSSQKKDLLTYKRLIDFRIEDHILNTKINIF